MQGFGKLFALVSLAMANRGASQRGLSIHGTRSLVGIKFSSGLGCRVLLLILAIFGVQGFNAEACCGLNHAYVCCANLKQLDGAKATWCLENNQDAAKWPGSLLTTNDLIGPNQYLQDMPICPLGGSYTVANPFAPTECSLHGTALSMNMNAQRPVAVRRHVLRLGMVLLSGTGLLLLSFSLPAGRCWALPDQVRRSVTVVCPLLMGAVTYCAAISQLPFEGQAAVSLSYGLTLLLCGRAALLKSRSARLVGWMVGSLFLGVVLHDLMFLKAGDCDIATRLMWNKWPL